MTTENRSALIVCVGHASVDHVFQVDQFPVKATKTPAHSYHAGGGGMAANAALAVARLGARVRFVGAVGEDDAGRLVRHQLAAQGIDLAHLQVLPDAHTSASAVIVDRQGERHIFNHRGDALARAQAPAAEAFLGCDAVLVDPRWPLGARTALFWARDHARLSMLDADVAPLVDLDALVPLADWVVFSEPGLGLWARGEATELALRRALEQGARHAAVTLGERGVGLIDGEQFRTLPAVAVQAVDTTAAGDVFHGAMLLALARGLSSLASCRFASAAAALKCTRDGGVLGAPTGAELDAFLQRRAQPPTP